MVSISIIAILSAIVMANFSSAREAGRDAQRKSDLTNLKAAIESYRQKNGVYPNAGCSGAANVWVNESVCSDYIVGLAPTFISRLPHDPNIRSYEGYSYTTNANHTVYKIMAYNTVENEVVTNTSDMHRCDTNGLCSVAGACAPSNAVYQKSYALWGGFADGNSDSAVITATAATICK